MKLKNEAIKRLKKDFPIFGNNPKLIYLDNAATSQKPKKVIKAITDFYEKDNANVSRGVYDLSEKATAKYEDSREEVAKLINADSEEIIFTRNATESLNLISYVIDSIIPKGKDEILVTEMEHHSNIVPWQQLAKRLGFKLKFVEITPDFVLDKEDLKKKLTDKTAIFAFTHVSNVLGTINDVNFLTKSAKSVGAITVIDAAQSIHNTKIDVKKIRCDFLAFSSHKMFGPTGVGVLYGKKDFLKKINPFNFGGGMIKKVSWKNTEFSEIPRKFEAGTPDIAGAIGLAEAVRYINKIGKKNIFEWEKKLADYLSDNLRKIKGVEVYRTKFGKNTGIVSFNLKGIHPHDVASLLNEFGIAIRAGHHCAMPLMEKLKINGTCRASFGIYNTFKDVDNLILAIKKTKEKFD